MKSKTSVLGLFADLVKPVVDAWEAEGGPKWFAGLRSRFGGWLQRLGGRIAGSSGIAVTVSVTFEVKPVSEVGAEIPHPTAPVPKGWGTVETPKVEEQPSAAAEPVPVVVPVKPKRVRKPSVKPAAPKAVKKVAAKPMKSAAQTKAKPKAAPRKRVKAGT
jgi:hypothetical protein